MNASPAAAARADRPCLELPLRPTGPAPATLVLTLCFVAAVTGILSVSRMAAWLPAAALGLAGLTAVTALWAGRRQRSWARNGWPLSLALATFAIAANVEQTRQTADRAVVDRLFRDALPPYDSVGVAAVPALEPAVERAAPRVRVAHVVAVVVEAPPPPAERHRLSGRARGYRLRTETIAAPGGPAEKVAVDVHLAVRHDLRLQPGDLDSGRIAASAGAGVPAFPAASERLPLYPLPGQRVEAIVQLIELDPGQTAPGQYDAPLQWLLGGLHARATIDPRQWRRLPDDGAVTPLVWARRAQIRLSEALNRHLNGRAADTLRALCWGDTSDLTVEDRAAFQRTGTVHLLAISGLHVYILLFLLLRAVGPLLAVGGGAQRWARHGLVAFLLWFFAAMTGFQEPVVRAVGMFTLWVGARALDRRFDALNALSLCGLTVLFVSPQSAHRIGFQLSYLSVGLLCWWGSALTDWLRRRVLGWLDRWLLPRLLNDLSQALAAGLIALFATLPLTVHAFGVAPAWAVAANLVLIPLMELLLVVALPLSLLFLFSEPGWPAAALQFATDQTLAAAEGLGAWCGSPADTPPPPGWTLPVCWLALLIAGAHFRRVTQPLLPLGDLAVRRRFGYPASGLALGLTCCAALALSGRWLPAATPGSSAVSGAPILLLGRLRPCVVATPGNAAGSATEPVSAWAAYALDDPAILESILRRPVSRWRLWQAPAARERIYVLTPAVWLLADTPAARAELEAQLAAHRGPPPLLLVALTADSSRSAAVRIPAAWAGRIRAVVLLESPWRLLEADAQAWMTFGRETGRPVLGADAAAVWAIEADGRGAWVTAESGESVFWPFVEP